MRVLLQRRSIPKAPSPGFSWCPVVAAAACAAALLMPAPALGQTPGAQTVSAPPRERPFLDGQFMVGVSGSHVLTPDSDLGQRWSVSPVFRPTPQRFGWAPTFGLNWYTGEISVPIDGRKTSIGEVRLRPVMAGVGYSFGYGPARTTLSVVSGYAFNSAVTYDDPDGRSAEISVSNAWVVRPSVSLTYALTRRLALISSIGYVYMDPTIQVTLSGHGTRTSHTLSDYRCDYVNFTLGTAFSLF